MKLYKTGGYVRDMLMGRKSKDVDYSCEAPSYEAMRDYLVNERGLILWLEKPEFLTLRGKLDGVDSDFTMCRKDGVYTDGRRPDDVTPGTLMDDLKRRDFTANAIALAEDGTIIDPFCGRTAIEYGDLFCVGNALDRFTEDSLRLARAVRFAVTHGFAMSADIKICLRDTELLGLLDNCAVERLQGEMSKAFRADTPRTLELLAEFPAFAKAVFRRGLRCEATLQQ